MLIRRVGAQRRSFPRLRRTVPTRAWARGESQEQEEEGEEDEETMFEEKSIFETVLLDGKRRRTVRDYKNLRR